MSLRTGSLCTGYAGLDRAVHEVIGGELAWVADLDLPEHVSEFRGIMSGTARCINTKRPLTHSLDLTEEGLAMQATQTSHPALTPTIRKRMLSRVTVDLQGPRPVDDAPCWIWTWGKNAYGYGSIRFGGRSHQAHRVMWELLRESIPESLQIDHLCRNHACCNPAHLEPVTQRINILRGTGASAHAASRTHCPQKHEYTRTNTRIAPDGSRRCRQCHRDDERARRERDRIGAAG